MKLLFRIGLLVVLGAVALLAALDRRPARIALRLGPHDFDGAPALAHGPVAEIGGEAREIVREPRMHAVAEFLGVPAADALLRFEVRLPEGLAGRPGITFRLLGQRIPLEGDIPREKLAALARGMPLKQATRGWSLATDPQDPARATLEVRPAELELPEPLGLAPRDGGRITLRLTALEPVASRLESRDLALPRHGTIELGWGILRGGAAVGTEVVFRASLACADRPAAELLVDRVTAGSGAAARWRDASIPLAGDPAPCRLRLTASGETHEPLAVWSTPQVTAPIDDGEPLPGPNLILVSLDTLRADHLSGYGYARATSPGIDRRLIAGGTTFDDVSTTFPQTDVAHLSLFTGLYAGAQPEPGRLPAESAARTLAENLRDAGCETAAFTEDALVAGAFGFWYGFDRFVERPFEPLGRGRRTFADAVRWLNTRGAGRRFFLFVHTYQVHGPYGASPVYDRLFADPREWAGGRLDAAIPEGTRADVDRYDRAIREADDLVGALLDELDRLGLAERTIVALVSDHGEAFGEHGTFGHGFAAHQEQLRVPFVLRGPGIPAGLRVAAPASLVDVAPTLLELAGAPPLADAQGVSLVPLLAGAPPAARPLFFSWYARPDPAGVRDGRWKLLRTGRLASLYDLERDPGERNPTVSGMAKTPPALRDALAANDSASQRLRAALALRSGHDAAAPAVDEEVERSLRALGYL